MYLIILAITQQTQPSVGEIPLTIWTAAMSHFTKHTSAKCEMHNLAVIAMKNSLINMRREAVPIDQQMLQQLTSTANQ